MQRVSEGGRGKDAWLGLYRAEIVGFQDPEQQGRLQIRCDKVLGENELALAIPLRPFNDMDYNPIEGDKCMIAFEEGKVDMPVIVGYFWTDEQRHDRIREKSDVDGQDVIIHRKLWIKKDRFDEEPKHELEVDEKAIFHEDVQMDKNLNVDGDITVGGSVDVDGSVHAGGDIIDGGNNTNHHTHPGM